MDKGLAPLKKSHFSSKTTTQNCAHSWKSGTLTDLSNFHSLYIPQFVLLNVKSPNPHYSTGRIQWDFVKLENHTRF